jgi:4-amino-4-deoxy-L-arabinose transferase-like glycosyltransferase
MRPPQARGGISATLLLVVVAGLFYVIGLAGPGFFDNEARYAEVARQMNERGDFVTPFMNGVPFLNKPPLTFWLVAVALRWVEPVEWARLVSVLAALATIVATVRLGAHLRGERHGTMAGVLLATMVGFVLEARTLRPDGLLMASTAWAMLCLWHAERDGARRTVWLVGFYVVLGLGVLAKGLVPLATVAPAVAIAVLGRHGWGGVRRLRPLLGAAVLAAVVLPWHVLVAARNPGFAWDFLVNQHLLFAIDKKEPRDSEGDPFAFFLGAFLGRTAPWCLLVLPVWKAPLDALRTRDPWALVPWAWMLTPVVVFGLVPSRLEHYTLPALPAVALLAAGPALALFDAGARAPRRLVLVLGFALAAAGTALVARGSALLAPLYWIGQAPGLAPLPALAGVILATGGAGAVATVALRRARGALACLAGAAIAFSALTVYALGVVSPLFSWREVAHAIDGAVDRNAEVVFESPVEYQLVGGLDFYLGRDVTLLEPPGGFVPPTYLEGYAGGMFVSRQEFERRWREPRPVVMVSDPLRRRDQVEGLAPPPFSVVARFGDRWVLGNSAAAR